MHLIIADTHFGKGHPDAERRKEQELIDCLRSVEGEVDSLILLGDVFEAFIEYRHLIPRGFVRFQALLAEWADRGVEVVCFAGNHDPWHVDYFETELGVRVVFDELVTDIGGLRTYLHHGDGLAPHSRRYRRLRPILRHRVPVWMYRNLLPGDFGMRLAHFVSRNFGEKEINQDVVEGLRGRARMLLDEGFEQVIFAHTHVPEIHTWPGGRYANPGSWHVSRTLLRITGGDAALLVWNGNVCEAYQGVEIPAA